MGAPLVGQQGNSGTSFHNSTAGMVTVSTTYTQGWIVLGIVTELGAGANTTVSNISSAHTTGWTKIGSLVYGGTAVDMEIWEGAYSSALSGEVITVQMGTTVDCGEIQWVELAGSNLVVDGNGTLPATASHQDFGGFTNTTPQVTGVSSNNAAAVVLGFLGSRTNIAAPTAGAGFTLLSTANSNLGTHNAVGAMEYETISAKLSGATLGFTGSYFDWGVIFLVIANPAAPPPTFTVTAATSVL
jgi:hypothetical protein